ncbi:methylated-DNA-[protein]-cysteine S-methyltransferase [Methylobacterium brachythecii]|nr:methylated-DNA-[protein]-cysteine S-methyltransferase [Methylobacterium brachythecii]
MTRSGDRAMLMATSPSQPFEAPVATYVHAVMPSPVGALTLVACERGLSAVLWENDDPLRVRLGSGNESPGHPVLADAKRQLTEYFAGRRRAFSLELDFRGTPFQQQVWQALLTIPYGETRSYGQIARQIGSPAAVRAVGAANGKNPISIIAPCHRVIGASGKLTGFAGGLQTKEFLLRLEGRRDLLDLDSLAGD